VNEGPKYVSLRDYLRVVRAHRIAIVVITLLFGGAAYLLSMREHKAYEAEAALSFLPPTRDASLVGTPVDTTQTPQERAAVNAETVHGPNTAKKVKSRVKTMLTPQQIAGSVSSHVETRTNLVVIQVRTGSPLLAAALANAYARVVADTATRASQRQLQRAIGSLRRSLNSPSTRGNGTPAIIARSNIEQQISRLEALKSFSQPVELVRAATIPSQPVSPRPVRNTLLGLLLGLTVAVLLAFGRDALDRRVRNAKDLADELNLPVLGHVNAKAMGRAGLAAGGRGPLRPEEMEAFRILRMNLEFIDVDRELVSILVTSALPEEGKSTVAASLAFAIAISGRRTLLVECDMRRPSLAARLGIDAAPGLSDYLVGHASIEDVMRPVPTGDSPSMNGDQEAAPASAENAPLVCISAGTAGPRPAEMLGSQRFKDFLEEAEKTFDVVLLDSPPLLSVVDARELIPCVDGVLLCIRASRTTRDQAVAGKAAVEHFPARPTGIVVTGLRRGEGPDYGEYADAYAYGRGRMHALRRS
jgi:Mrp family chromosome partitioning ATPase/capsular polysaccharide biosynthesis protein